MKIQIILEALNIKNYHNDIISFINDCEKMVSDPNIDKYEAPYKFWEEFSKRCYNRFHVKLANTTDHRVMGSVSHENDKKLYLSIDIVNKVFDDIKLYRTISPSAKQILIEVLVHELTHHVQKTKRDYKKAAKNKKGYFGDPSEISAFVNQNIKNIERDLPSNYTSKQLYDVISNTFRFFSHYSQEIKNQYIKQVYLLLQQDGDYIFNFKPGDKVKVNGNHGLQICELLSIDGDSVTVQDNFYRDNGFDVDDDEPFIVHISKIEPYLETD